MNGKELRSKIKELEETNQLVCTNDELSEYLAYGMLLKFGSKYKTRTGKDVKVELLDVKNTRMSINLSNLIGNCIELASKNKTQHVYCMTTKTYQKYKMQNLIVTKGDIEYYRIFENELWLVYKI